ncbi:hypothetical protein KBY72_13950 [Cyanobium sp. BA5m-21]|uniref:hypothetical protein n=1 Tax=unclassified Cyanobium TaxID=2627006 RepID=UPI0020CDA212|nr:MULTISPECIES: hypothetical protein [unclassified Cyanobium]MCP9903115.1 hypothetical protein [Cyanobium sp. BA5m-10]MCP9908262.1 hypothetical protein [Cyanobium sp. BA5m-21]
MTLPSSLVTALGNGDLSPEQWVELEAEVTDLASFTEAWNVVDCLSDLAVDLADSFPVLYLQYAKKEELYES